MTEKRKPERRDRAAALPDRSGGRIRGFTRRAVNSLQSHPWHYAGSVRVGAHVVPVEIRVLDFELPAPKGYLKPALDYRVSSYNYYAWDIILAYNGGDIRQVFAAYANYRREDTA